MKEIFKPLTYEKIKSDGPICNAKLSGKGKYLITQHLFALNATEPEKVHLHLQSTARIVSLRIFTKDTTSQFTQAWVDSVIAETMNLWRNKVSARSIKPLMRVRFPIALKLRCTKKRYNFWYSCSWESKDKDLRMSAMESSSGRLCWEELKKLLLIVISTKIEPRECSCDLFPRLSNTRRGLSLKSYFHRNGE